jgi:hypothetical protein
MRIRNLRLCALRFFEIPPQVLWMAELNTVSITKEFEPQIYDKFHSEYFGTLLSVLLYLYPALIHSCVTGTIYYSNQFTDSLNKPLIKR